MAKKFIQYIINMSIIMKNILIKVYYLIDMIKHYYRLLQQIYSIITSEILGIKLNLVLQIIFKAINNLVSPNNLVLILLVFDNYFRMIEQNALSFLIIQRDTTMPKIINKIRKHIASYYINNALNFYNSYLLS